MNEPLPAGSTDLNANARLPLGACLSLHCLRAFVANESLGENTDTLRAHVLACPSCHSHAERLRQQGAAPTSSQPAPRVEGFSVQLLLGKGGEGLVWLAKDEQSNRLVAIKVLHPHRRGGDALERLQHELGCIQNLPAHRHRLRAHGIRQTSEGPALVMEFLTGNSLKEIVEPANQTRQPLEWRLACEHLANIADALVDVHAAGLYHGDITPRNILFRHQPELPVLTDFGLARSIGESIGGSPGYSAPELLEKPGGPASDVFGLAATLFFLVAGRPPYRSDKLMESRQAAAKGPGGLIYPPEIPDELQALIAGGLDPDPTSRLDLIAFRDQLRRLPNLWLGDRLTRLVEQLPPILSLQATATLLTRGGQRRESVRCELGGNGLTTATGELRGCTGDALVIQALADRAGYLTLMNLASNGVLHFPQAPQPGGADKLVRELQRTGTLSAPPGTDRLAVIWSEAPLPCDAESWREWVLWVEDNMGELQGLTARTWEEQPLQTSKRLDRVAVVFTVHHEPEET